MTQWQKPSWRRRPAGPKLFTIWWGPCFSAGQQSTFFSGRVGNLGGWIRWERRTEAWGPHKVPFLFWFGQLKCWVSERQGQPGMWVSGLAPKLWNVLWSSDHGTVGVIILFAEELKSAEKSRTKNNPFSLLLCRYSCCKHLPCGFLFSFCMVGKYCTLWTTPSPVSTFLMQKAIHVFYCLAARSCGKLLGVGVVSRTGIWTQDFALAKQELYSLSHTLSPRTVCLG
jgi:hypothetical protein